MQFDMGSIMQQQDQDKQDKINYMKTIEDELRRRGEL